MIVYNYLLLLLVLTFKGDDKLKNYWGEAKNEPQSALGLW